MHIILINVYKKLVFLKNIIFR